jgi:hypothetical protein
VFAKSHRLSRTLLSIRTIPRAFRFRRSFWAAGAAPQYRSYTSRSTGISAYTWPLRWAAKRLLSHEELFEKAYDRLPKEFFFMRELLLSALWRSPEK